MMQTDRHRETDEETSHHAHAVSQAYMQEERSGAEGSACEAFQAFNDDTQSKGHAVYVLPPRITTACAPEAVRSTSRIQAAL